MKIYIYIYRYIIYILKNYNQIVVQTLTFHLAIINKNKTFRIIISQNKMYIEYICIIIVFTKVTIVITHVTFF